MNSNTTRLDVVDALRGFAIVSIMLLHNIEHFDLYHLPAGLPDWLKGLDRMIWDTAFFLFGGKSYAIFALLFGITFFIQFHHRAVRGEDFRPRFAWRLMLLLGFGILNSMFYHGDILTIYAVLGVTLIPVARWRDGLVLALAAVLLLQPAAWLDFILALPHPDLKLGDPASWAYFGRANDYLSAGSVTEVWSSNLSNGKIGVIRWSWENGRIFQIPALFMLGMLAGRKALFIISEENKRFWQRVFVGAGVLFIPLFYFKNHLHDWINGPALQRPLDVIIASWSNLVFMLVLVSVFTLLFQTEKYARVLRIFAPLGKMSLTSYVMQSVIGTFIYYGFGLGLYQTTGASYSLLIGITLALLQGSFSAWWLRHHKQGPLEALWHRATWAGSRKQAALP